MQAIGARNADAVETAMRAHLAEVLAALPNLAARFSGHFDAENAP